MGFPAKTPDVLAWMARTDNGRIPLNELEEIVPRFYDLDLNGPAVMWGPAARAMSDMLAAAKADGRLITVKYSYRTFAKQVEKWENFQNGGTLAAEPGTSNHGDALTVDLTNLDALDIYWLNRNAHKYGFYADVNGEIWHWTYYGGYDAGNGEDIEMDLYIAGWDKYIERWNNAGGKDPGEAPKDREKRFKDGWGHARKAMNNPKSG